MGSKDEVDTTTKEFVKEALASQNEHFQAMLEAESAKLPELAASTPVPIRLTLKQAWGILVGAGFALFTLIGGAVGLYTRDMSYRHSVDQRFVERDNKTERLILERDHAWERRLTQVSEELGKQIATAIKEIKTNGNDVAAIQTNAAQIALIIERMKQDDERERRDTNDIDDLKERVGKLEAARKMTPVPEKR